MNQGPEGASIFILSEKRKIFALLLEAGKGSVRLWGRSVAAQSNMTFKTEIWRRLSSLEHHGVAVNKEKSKN